MAIRTIITEPNKLLRQISKPVNSVGKEEQKLMDDMLETMYDANGIGLAAIQIGVPKRTLLKLLLFLFSRNPQEKHYLLKPLHHGFHSREQYGNKP